MKKRFTTFLLIVISSLLYAQEWISVKGGSSFEPRVTLVGLTGGEISANVSIDGFQKYEVGTPAGVMNRIVIAGGTNETEAGFPDVQHLTVSLMIPETGNFRINVTKADFTEYDNIPVAPSKGDPQFSDIPGWENPVYNENLISNNDFYPASIAEAGQPYIWCDTRGMALQIYPFAYNPVTGVLRVYHTIEVRLKTDSAPGMNELTRYSGSYGRMSGLSALSKSHFINYTESNRYAPVEEGGNMLIVAPENYRSVIQPFIDWKTRCGINCEFADVAAFQSAEQIRQFVSEKYYGEGLTYLVLAGDAAQVPTLQAENGASDNMFGYIAGDDHYPEVLVGRFPAENANQLAIMVKRSVDYEKFGNGKNAYSNFLSIASEEGPGDDGEKDFEHLRNIGKTLQTYNYRNLTEMYDGSQGEADSNGNPTASMVETAVNEGQGAIMYIGHGSSGAWTTSAFSGNQAAGLSNTETHPFIWAAGCSSGDFTTTTCLAERWLRAEKNGNPAGAVAVMMSTSRQSWYPPMEAQDEMALILARKKESVTTRTFGGISMGGCMKMNDKYGPGGYKVTDTWNIFGDPSVVVRTASPLEIQALHAQTIGAGAREFEVGLNVPGAMVCITSNGKLYGAGKVLDETAVISLNEIPETGVLQLTVSAYNYLPYTAEIEITRLPSVAVDPEPVNFAGKVSPFTSLFWDAKDGMTPAFYEILISENPDMSNPLETLVSFTRETKPQFRLAYATTFYWKVISYNEYGSTESRIFNFTTANPPDEDFENQGFPRSNWSNSGDFSWFIDGNTSFEGNYSLRSGIIDDLGSSRLAYSCYSHACEYISFRLKISSQTNADFLKLVIDGDTLASYSGVIDWTEEKFGIDPGEHLIEWIYSKDASESQGMDGAWIDNIYLPGNLDPLAITDDVETCKGNDVELSIQATGSSRVEWLSESNGIFDDYNSHFPVYTPSQEDIDRGYVTLFTDVYGNDFCDPVRYETTVTFHALPELPQINDTILYAGEAMEIALPIAANADYKLLPYGKSGSVFTIKAEELNEGENLLTVSCENELGCSVEKSFTVTVIKAARPLAGKELLIYPNPAVDQISFAGNIEDNGRISVKMFNISGQLVVQSDQDGIYNNRLDISGLPEGMYMVRIENGKEVQHGRFLKLM